MHCDSCTSADQCNDDGCADNYAYNAAATNANHFCVYGEQIYWLMLNIYNMITLRNTDVFIILLPRLPYYVKNLF